VAHLDLVTTNGPSWKPFPVVFTTVFSGFGDGAAPLLWLLIARTGGLLAIAMAYRLARRLGGASAGIIAAVSLVLANDFVDSFARGNSEGLLVALILWAIDRHLERRYHQAFLLGVAAGLLRPETWPFLVLYGIWLLHRDWRRGARRRTLALVGGAGAFILVLWLVPEYIGSGSLLRGAARAREPVAGSPAQTSVPFLSVFGKGSSALDWPVYAGAVIAVAFAVRTYVRERRITTVLALATAATALMITVGLLAEAGFTGNPRYVTIPAAITCVLGGVGWATLIRALHRHEGTAVAAASGVVAAGASVPFIASDLSQLGGQLDGLQRAAASSAALPAAIRQASRVAALQHCRPVYTGTFNVPLVAWELHLHQDQLSYRPRPPGTLIVTADSPEAGDPRFRSVARTRQWEIASTCATRA